MVAVVYGLHVCGATVAYKVNYDGKVIATVKNKQQFTKAVDIVKEKVNLADSKKVEEAVSEPHYSTAIVLDEVIDDDYVLADAIIENTEKIVYASSLYVNGDMIACVEESTLKECLDKRLNEFKTDGDCTVKFVDSVSVDNGYFLEKDIDDIKKAQDLIDTLEVMTVVTVKTDVEIDYNTVTKLSNEKLQGDTSVETEGQKGIRRITENVTLINGVETERQQICDEVIKESVDEVVVVGNAKPSNQRNTTKGGFLFPLPKGVWQVSAYFGDGRGHKGVDLRSPKGTSIYAVADGKVTYASYYGGYGNCIKIDHGNGLTTLYAHASKLCVNVGDTVKAGDVIALVGCTGDSSGNHLHFEVIANNRNVNPAQYIGIN